jgi:hypothetical protein
VGLSLLAQKFNRDKKISKQKLDYRFQTSKGRINAVSQEKANFIKILKSTLLVQKLQQADLNSYVNV